MSLLKPQTYVAMLGTEVVGGTTPSVTNSFPFFQFFELYFWRTPSNPYPLITHTLACPPIGMGYEGFYCSVIYYAATGVVLLHRLSS